MKTPSKLYHDTSHGAQGDIRSADGCDTPIAQIQPQGVLGKKSGNDHRQNLAREMVRRWNCHEDLLKVIRWQREWIDAVPQDTVLPAMPGFDRDHFDEIVQAATCPL